MADRGFGTVLDVSSMGDTGKKHVVIVGGGFAGLNAAKKLAKNKNFLITVLDRHNYHLFQPLLYQVAMAGLSPGEIATPIRSVLAKYKNTRVLMAEVLRVEAAQNQIVTDMGPLKYDYLVLACGAQHSYFGHEEWEPLAPGLKTLEQATEVRRRVLTAFEMAEREPDKERLKQLLTFVIIGGGPTGVELAGALGEICRYTLSNDFRHIDPESARIIIVEAGSRVLATFDPKLSRKAERDLEELGVTIWTNTRVTGIDEEGVTLGAEKLKAATVLWAAGVKPNPINTSLGVPLDKAGRVIVEKDLSIPGHKNVFVVGDQACVVIDGGPLPGLAPVAMQEGRFVAETIANDLKNRERRPFKYFDKGQMATIGRSKAVVETHGLKFGGVIAWYAWLLIHIYYLIGFKNRMIVLIQWFWGYLTYRRGAQLIVSKEWRSFAEPKAPLPDGPSTAGGQKKLVHV